MDIYQKIEEMIAQKNGRTTIGRGRKATGDFLLDDDHAINVKSNNIAKKNYSPNMVSSQVMHKWVFEKNRKLSFIFVDYTLVDNEIHIQKESPPIPIEHISWKCLTIEAQGYGAIQKKGDLIVDPSQTKQQFYEGFLAAYATFREKERVKHEKFCGTFLDPAAIR